MTKIQRYEVQCAICGAVSSPMFLLSTNTFGGEPDLDTRPPEMKRSTLCVDIQRCDLCGYCAPRISKSTGHFSAVVESEEYRKQLNNPDFPALANYFLCYAMLATSDKYYVAAAWSSLRAAWVCDDHDCYKASAICRRQAIEMFIIAEANAQHSEVPDGTMDVLMIDLFRRTGQFVEAQSWCNEGLKKNLEEYLQNILHFQLQLIEKQDVACHSISDIKNSK